MPSSKTLRVPKPCGEVGAACMHVSHGSAWCRPAWWLGWTLCLVLLHSPLAWGASPAAGGLKVAATIFPLYDMVREVAGPHAEVVLLVPPGASPHTFAVTPGTVRSLAGCAAVFTIGHGLDAWATRLAQEAGVPRTVVTDAGIRLRRGAHAHHDHGHTQPHAHTVEAVDPHYWLTIPNAQLMVQTIATVLGQLAPTAATALQQRASAYQARMQAVDAEIRQLLADLPRRDIATLHMALEYFAEAYGLRVVAVFEPVPGKEPGPRYVQAFQRQVQKHKLRVVFTEPQLSETALRGLTQDLGITLRPLSPDGGLPGVESYLDLMRYTATQIATALRE